MTVPIPAGGSLRVEAARNSGVHVREADRADFEIVACKAAPSADACPRSPSSAPPPTP